METPLWEVLDRIEDFLELQADAEYLPDRAEPVGNEPMRLLIELRSARAPQEKPVACAQDRASIASDAADEIERLRAERADYRCRWADAESKLAFCDGDLQTVQAERDALKARIDGAPVMFAGQDDGQWHASSEWQDAQHVRLHVSGFGDDAEQSRVVVKRVALVVVDDGEGGKA